MEEKLSLIKLSKKSWHFKLNKYIYGSRLINGNMRNLCPYFWMLMLALILAPIWGIFDLLLFRPFNWVVDMAERNLEENSRKWTQSLSPEEITNVFTDPYGGFNRYGFVSIPKTIRRMSYEQRTKLLKEWAQKHLNIDVTTDEGQTKWVEYVRSTEERRAIAEARAIERQKEQDRIEYERLEKKRAKEQAIRNKFNSIAQPFNWFFRKIREAFTFDTTGKIVRASKRVIGAIITSGLVIGLYFVVQYIVFVVMLIADVWDTSDVLNGMLWTGIALAGVAVFVGLVFLIKYFVEQYKEGKKRYVLIDAAIWIGTYLIYYPVKILVYYPLYFVIWSFICKTIGVAIIWNSLVSFWKGLMSVTGIFGEYFGRSKGDYCPGIDWEE